MLGFKLPKDDGKYQWTNHVKDKMLYYRISESLIKRIVRFPKRREVGIAPGTVAVMQPTQNKKQPQEIWVMYVEVGRQSAINHQLLAVPKLRIISAWRYPGISPVGQPIPIPDEVLMDIDAALAE